METPRPHKRFKRASYICRAIIIRSLKNLEKFRRILVSIGYFYALFPLATWMCIQLELKKQRLNSI
jgi:hypothetical protein